MNDIENRAAMFRSLGDPTRLKIFEFLRASCCALAVDEKGDVRPVVAADGPTVGEVRRVLGSFLAK
jgi:ArsR family transcriptional regulator, arsenate/arsenite/antimonite-responsive transcriptional repressor